MAPWAACSKVTLRPQLFLSVRLPSSWHIHLRYSLSLFLAAAQCFAFRALTRCSAVPFGVSMQTVEGSSSKMVENKPPVLHGVETTEYDQTQILDSDFWRSYFLSVLPCRGKQASTHLMGEGLAKSAIAEMLLLVVICCKNWNKSSNLTWRHLFLNHTSDVSEHVNLV